MKTRPKLVEIVPDMYPDLLFWDMSFKPQKINEKVLHYLAFYKDSFLTPSRGLQRVAEGDVITWNTLSIKIHFFFIGPVTIFKTWFCNSKYTQKWKTTLPFVCYFHIIHLHKQIMNQQKFLLTFLLTFYN